MVPVPWEYIKVPVPNMHSLIKKHLNMNLFINTISTDSIITLFDNDRQIVDSFIWLAKGKESATLIPNIDTLLKKNNITYPDLENIVLVNGPWSFTWVRTSVLVINSINYIIKKDVTALSFFDLYNTYPIIKSSSKRDCFVQKSKDAKIEIIPNQDLITYISEENIPNVYWDFTWVITSELKILEKIDYEAIIKALEFNNLEKIDPLYIKKPSTS